jgi:hypothetical protein
MAEEIPGEPPFPADDYSDDVLGKIDQLLNRHRPKAPVVETIPVLTDEDVPIDDGIPVLTDIVSGPGQPASLPPGLSRSSTVSSALILQRLGIALDVEHIRLLAQIDRNDAEQARMLDRLVAELKRALPGAVRSAIKDKALDPPQPEDDGRL